MWKEKFNSLLYGQKKIILPALRAIAIISAVLAFSIVIYQFGFPHDDFEFYLIDKATDIIITVFAVDYFIRVLYSFHRREFISSTKFEFALMSLVLIIGICKYFFDFHIVESVFHNFAASSARKYVKGFMSLVLMYFVFIEFAKASTFLSNIKLQPATTFIFSFLLLITIGTGLLMMPNMTSEGTASSLMQAMFTSVSASCVTGLSVVDVSSFYSYKGHLVILFLMQLGGIGMISFASFFASFLKSGVGIKQQLIIQDFLSSDSLFSAKGLLRQVIIMTLVIETITCIAIFFTWGNEIAFESVWQKIFYSVFHAVSAFCNAGFSLFPNGLFQDVLQHSHLLHVVIAFAIILGGIGFSSLQDILSPKNLRERIQKPWMDWKLSTKISIFTSLALILFGAICFMLLENNNQLKGMGKLEAIVASFFQSVTTRTAGFNTVDISRIGTSTLILFIFLMFIGASSGSTGGGIKTSTFIIILKSAFATIKGQREVNMGTRQINNELIFKAHSIFLFAATFNLVMIFLLSITEADLLVRHGGMLRLVFEQVSAFATVGLSTGITPELSETGKALIIISMFVGRIGTLTLALAISTRVSSRNYHYPTAHLMVG